MSDTLSNKQMEAAVEAAEADTQRVIDAQLRQVMPPKEVPALNKEQMLARISLLSDEMDANDEEPRDAG